MEGEEPQRIRVHPDLVKEFEAWKKILEEKAEFPINGGIPIVSKLCATILAKHRTMDKKDIRIQVEKVKGVKKVNVTFL